MYLNRSYFHIIIDDYVYWKETWFKMNQELEWQSDVYIFQKYVIEKYFIYFRNKLFKKKKHLVPAKKKEKKNQENTCFFPSNPLTNNFVANGDVKCSHWQLWINKDSDKAFEWGLGLCHPLHCLLIIFLPTTPSLHFFFFLITPN